MEVVYAGQPSPKITSLDALLESAQDMIIRKTSEIIYKLEVVVRVTYLTWSLTPWKLSFNLQNEIKLKIKD